MRSSFRRQSGSTRRKTPARKAPNSTLLVIAAVGADGANAHYCCCLRRVHSRQAQSSLSEHGVGAAISMLMFLGATLDLTFPLGCAWQHENRPAENKCCSCNPPAEQVSGQAHSSPFDSLKGTGTNTAVGFTELRVRSWSGTSSIGSATAWQPHP